MVLVLVLVLVLVVLVVLARAAGDEQQAVRRESCATVNSESESAGQVRQPACLQPTNRW